MTVWVKTFAKILYVFLRNVLDILDGTDESFWMQLFLGFLVNEGFFLYRLSNIIDVFWG
jgi:hypothetical protein